MGVCSRDSLSTDDLRVAVFKQRNFKGKLHVIELDLIHRFRTMDSPGLNKDIGFLSHMY